MFTGRTACLGRVAGTHRCFPAPQNRACAFQRTRLKQACGRSVRFGAILPVTSVQLPVAQCVYDFQIVEVVAPTPAAVLQVVHVNPPV